MSQLNSLAIQSSHKSLSEHPFRKALILLLAGAGTTIAAAQAAQRIQQQPAPAPTTTMASNTIPPLPNASNGSASATNDGIEILHKAPNIQEMIPNKPYYFQNPNGGQVMVCRNWATPLGHRLGCQPTNVSSNTQQQQGR